jgi:hypothetical protein
MILNNISKYVINRFLFSFILTIASTVVLAQEEKLEDKEVKNKPIVASDTIPYKFGLRIGIDIGGPISMLLDGNKTLFKGNFDARVYKKYFVSGEFGYEKQLYKSENLNFTSDGSFFTFGGDYDMLGYTPGRNDLMAFGVRYGMSKFTQTVDEYRIQNGYWNDDAYIGHVSTQQAYAHWLNLRLGLKVEVLRNFYLGAAVGVNFLVHDTRLENFDNLYIPGFGDNKNNKSWVFNYTLMYFLPFN